MRAATISTKARRTVPASKPQDGAPKLGAVTIPWLPPCCGLPTSCCRRRADVSSCCRSRSASLVTSRILSCNSSSSRAAWSSASFKSALSSRRGCIWASTARFTSGNSRRSTIRIPAFDAMRRSARPLLSASSSDPLPMSKPASSAAKRRASTPALFCVFGITHPKSHLQRPPPFCT